MKKRLERLVALFRSPEPEPFSPKELHEMKGHEFYLVITNPCFAVSQDEGRLVKIEDRKKGIIIGYEIGRVLRTEWDGASLREFLPEGDEPSDYLFRLQTVSIDANTARLVGTVAPFNPRKNILDETLEGTVEVHLVEIPEYKKSEGIPFFSKYI